MRSVAQRGRLDLDERQLKGDNCASIKISGIGCDASSFIGPSQVVKLAERYSAESESNYRQREGEEGNGIRSRPLPKSFAFFILVSGLFSFLITSLLLVLWERVR